MDQTFKYEKTIKLVLVTCCACLIEYGIPEPLDKRLLEEREQGTTYCPNGHQWHYTGKSAEQKLRDAEAKVKLAEARAIHERDQRLAAERSASALRGENTKLRTRAKNGVCPCCHRTFAQLQRHMSTKHPDYQGAEVTP